MYILSKIYEAHQNWKQTTEIKHGTVRKSKIILHGLIFKPDFMNIHTQNHDVNHTLKLYEKDEAFISVLLRFSGDVSHAFWQLNLP